MMLEMTICPHAVDLTIRDCNLCNRETRENIMFEALEAIAVIEEDSPAAFGATKLIVQETIDAVGDKQ